ncbi:hypothetical protein F8388_015699 [Cannabis sativa]|uniref:DUF4283 domain-containing protein n=1 Tax=Cannabis sativa TaxID=3483 RepID=A0A7J6HHN1_CANSA|nr:hypothetical protein F8388_015699 [Cannabis sativa]KAF4403029.1 hypothetical protein G4B88_010481 [Cannabis sativa]
MLSCAVWLVGCLWLFGCYLVFAFTVMEFVCHSELVVGKNLSLFVATISLIPCDSTIKSLNSLCLFGKVIGPLIVDENCLKAFTEKEWGRHVFVSLVPDVAKKSNLFELIFKEAKDRESVLDNGPWIVKGSHLLLKTWSPLSEILNSFMVARLWVQIHNLSFEFFSIVNGNDMGALVGFVVKVDLDENKPATWSKWLRILIDVWIESPLFLGCYIENDNGTKIWIQFKYEKIDAFVITVDESTIFDVAAVSQAKIPSPALMARDSPCSILGSMSDPLTPTVLPVNLYLPLCLRHLEMRLSWTSLRRCLSRLLLDT